MHRSADRIERAESGVDVDVGGLGGLRRRASAKSGTAWDALKVACTRTNISAVDSDRSTKPGNCGLELRRGPRSSACRSAGAPASSRPALITSTWIHSPIVWRTTSPSLGSWPWSRARRPGPTSRQGDSSASSTRAAASASENDGASAGGGRQGEQAGDREQDRQEAAMHGAEATGHASTGMRSSRKRTRKAHGSAPRGSGTMSWPRSSL